MTVQKFKPRGSTAAEDQRPSGDILLSASNETLDNDKEQRQTTHLTSPTTNPPSPRNPCCRSTQPQQLTTQQQQQQFQQDQQQQRQDSSENLLGRVLAVSSLSSESASASSSAVIGKDCGKFSSNYGVRRRWLANLKSSGHWPGLLPVPSDLD
ncbi:hypothetical protein M0804_010915 [Polistes exclamans]|nr:hypothetical protein M0804_010915 [Polistes exclamans]